jgi:hypothetical protein
MKNLHFELPHHEALKCDTLVRSMQNLKQKEYINDTRRPKCPKPLFIRTKAFVKVATRGDAFFIYILPSPNVEPFPHEIPS